MRLSPGLNRFTVGRLGYGESVERESTKHGAREDEDLARGVEGLIRGAPVDPRSAEDRRLEDPGEESDGFEAPVRPDVAQPDVLLDERTINQRAELSRLLTGLHYPATRDEVLAVAESNAADEPVLGLLGALPDGKFDLFEAIWEATGGPPDPPREETL